MPSCFILIFAFTPVISRALKVENTLHKKLVMMMMIDEEKKTKIKYYLLNIKYTRMMMMMRESAPVSQSVSQSSVHESIQPQSYISYRERLLDDEKVITSYNNNV